MTNSEREIKDLERQVAGLRAQILNQNLRGYDGQIDAAEKRGFQRAIDKLRNISMEDAGGNPEAAEFLADWLEGKR